MQRKTKGVEDGGEKQRAVERAESSGAGIRKWENAGSATQSAAVNQRSHSSPCAEQEIRMSPTALTQQFSHLLARFHEGGEDDRREFHEPLSDGKLYRFNPCTGQFRLPGDVIPGAAVPGSE